MRRRRPVRTSRNPATTPELEVLQDEMAKWVQEQALFYYRLGRWAAQLGCADLEGREDILARGVEALGVDPSVVSQALQLYRWLPDQAALDELLSRRGRGGVCLGWGHLVHLLPFRDLERREALIGRVLRDGLTPHQLKEAILREEKAARAECDPQQNSLRRCLAGWRSTSAKLLDKLGPNFASTVLGPLQVLRVNDADADLLRKVAAARRGLETLADQAAQRAGELADLEGPLQAALDLEPPG